MNQSSQTHLYKSDKSHLCSVQIQQSTTPVSVYQQPISSPQHISSMLYYQPNQIQSALLQQQLEANVESLVLEDRPTTTTDKMLEQSSIPSIHEDFSSQMSHALDRENRFDKIGTATAENSRIESSQSEPLQYVEYQQMLLSPAQVLDLETQAQIQSPAQVQLIPSSNIGQQTVQIVSSQSQQLIHLPQNQQLQISTIQYQHPLESDIPSLQVM